MSKIQFLFNKSIDDEKIEKLFFAGQSRLYSVFKATLTDPYKVIEIENVVLDLQNGNTIEQAIYFLKVYSSNNYPFLSATYNFKILSPVFSIHGGETRISGYLFSDVLTPVEFATIVIS